MLISIYAFQLLSVAAGFLLTSKCESTLVSMALPHPKFTMMVDHRDLKEFKGFGKKADNDTAARFKKRNEENGSSRQLLLQFTCNRCEGRTSLKINKLAYEEGVVICTCSQCGVRHLIADNKGLMDDPEFGRGNIEQYMARNGRNSELTKLDMSNMNREQLEKFDIEESESLIEVIRKKNNE